jgi:hypothetical protein
MYRTINIYHYDSNFKPNQITELQNRGRYTEIPPFSDGSRFKLGKVSVSKANLTTKEIKNLPIGAYNKILFEGSHEIFQTDFNDPTLNIKLVYFGYWHYDLNPILVGNLLEIIKKCKFIELRPDNSFMSFADVLSNCGILTKFEYDLAGSGHGPRQIQAIILDKFIRISSLDPRIYGSVVNNNCDIQITIPGVRTFFKSNGENFGQPFGCDPLVVNRMLWENKDNPEVIRKFIIDELNRVINEISNELNRLLRTASITSPMCLGCKLFLCESYEFPAQNTAENKKFCRTCNDIANASDNNIRMNLIANRIANNNPK